MKTLYISDLDGTLLGPDAALSPETTAIINRLSDQGLLFTVATARSIASVRNILKDIRLSVPVVLMNGVCIYDFNVNDYLKIEYLPPKSVEQLMQIIKSYRLKGFAYSIKDGKLSTYYEDIDSEALREFYNERVKLYRKRFTQIEDFSSLTGEPLIYFTLLDRREQLEHIYRAIEAAGEFNCVFYKDNYSPDLWYLEIYSRTASKFHAVQALRDLLEPDRIVCFGDNRNDFPLFEAGDLKIAVGNAVEELKAKADLIIGKNTQDGVAVWLKENAELPGVKIM